MIILINGDCLEKLKNIPDNSVDSIVTDPPYGLSFMGKKWDYDVPSEDVWRECLRVLKPGGHLLAFAGTRTQHRMAVRIEDAGFEIRDMIAWVYGSGFPKSRNIGLDIDKRNGVTKNRGKAFVVAGQSIQRDKDTGGDLVPGSNTMGAYKAQNEWSGWGTALKPALEPITVARKPLSEKTIAENVLTHGTGGINIDGCRVGTEVRENPQYGNGGDLLAISKGGEQKWDGTKEAVTGRFPANLLHDGSEEVVGLFPANVKGSKATGLTQTKTRSWKNTSIAGINRTGYEDNGSAARFFYCAKSSRRDRNDGLDGTLTVKYNSGVCHEENMVAVQLLEKVILDTAPVSFNIGESGASIMAQCHQDSLSTTLTKIKQTIELKIFSLLTLSLTSESTQDANSETENGGSLVKSADSLPQWLLGITNGQMELARGASRVASQMLQAISDEDAWKPMTNIHSTVKPTDLMRYLCRLVTPPGGTVLDPFMGSGSTGKAAVREGFGFIGIELDPEYMEIARKRIKNHIVTKELFK